MILLQFAFNRTVDRVLQLPFKSQVDCRRNTDEMVNQPDRERLVPRGHVGTSPTYSDDEYDLVIPTDPLPRVMLPEREGDVDDAVQLDDAVDEKSELAGLDRAGEHLAEPPVRSVPVGRSTRTTRGTHPNRVTYQRLPDRKVLMQTGAPCKQPGIRSGPAYFS